MKKANNILKIFLLADLILFTSFKSQAAITKCHRNFKNNHSSDQTAQQMNLFPPDVLSDQPKGQIDLFSHSPLEAQSLNGSAYSVNDPTHSLIEDLAEAKRLTQQQKDQIRDFFLSAFKSRNLKDMRKLVRNFPFLKEIRFTDSSLLKEISEYDRYWCPKGWSPLQISAYKKDLDFLDFFLDLGMDIRTVKGPGGVSLESNPLHIAIRMDFEEGAERILTYAKKTNFSLKNRFINEKDHNKHTPWFLAVKQDSKRPHKIRYIHIIGRHKPSGYVMSYTREGSKDGYEVAALTGNNIIKLYARTYLVAPAYEKYKDIRNNSPRPKLLPP